jgi:hypothetical protein
MGWATFWAILSDLSDLARVSLIETFFTEKMRPLCSYSLNFAKSYNKNYENFKFYESADFARSGRTMSYSPLTNWFLMRSEIIFGSFLRY